jgi:hypothetical protein
MPLLPYDKDLYTIYSMTTIDYFNRPNAHLLPYPLLRACADRLATFHTCRFSERLSGLFITH